MIGDNGSLSSYNSGITRLEDEEIRVCYVGVSRAEEESMIFLIPQIKILFLYIRIIRSIKRYTMKPYENKSVDHIIRMEKPSAK